MSRVKKTIRRTLASRGLIPEIKRATASVLEGNVPISFAAAGINLLEVNMEQGTNSNDFVGANFRLKYIQFQGMIYNSADNTYRTRIICVCDLQPTSEALVLYQPASSEGFYILSAPNVASPVLARRPTRFKLMYDRTFTLEPQGMRNRTSFRAFLPCGNALITKVPGALAGTYAANRTYMWFIVSEVAGQIFDVFTRVGFTDV